MSGHHEVAFARGAYAVLSAWASFAIVDLAEQLADLGIESVSSRVALLGLVSVLATFARAALLLRIARRARAIESLEAWRAVALTIGAVVGWLGRHAVSAAKMMILARHVSVDRLAGRATVTATIGMIEGFCTFVLVLVALWVAFVRGRDLPPQPIDPSYSVLPPT